MARRWPWQRSWTTPSSDGSRRSVARDRVPEGWEQAIDQDPHEQVLRASGARYEGSFEFSAVERWSVESLIGFVYSTSFLNRAVLGQRVDAFESDLGMRLLAC